MARILMPNARQCRPRGEKLFLKGQTWLHRQMPNRAPQLFAGTTRTEKLRQHVRFRAEQLREKQKLRAVIYGPPQSGRSRKTYARLAQQGVTVRASLSCWSRAWIPSLVRMGSLRRAPRRSRIVRRTPILLVTCKPPSTMPSYQCGRADMSKSRRRSKEAASPHRAQSLPRNAWLPGWIEVNAKGMKGTFSRFRRVPSCRSTINKSLVVELFRDTLHSKPAQAISIRS